MPLSGNNTRLFHVSPVPIIRVSGYDENVNLEINDLCHFSFSVSLRLEWRILEMM